MANPNDAGGTWSREQIQNAQTIINVGLRLGASQRDIRVALMVAMQESGLRNLDYGDRDSIGLFQQRDAWGTREQRLDPEQSAMMFFKGGHAGQRGLFDFEDRDSMRLTEEAQAVQVSAYPDAYAKWHEDAAGLIQRLGLDGDGPKALAGTPAPTAQAASTTYQDLLTPAVPDPISEQIQPASQSILGIEPAQAIDSFGEVSSAFTPTYPNQKLFQAAAGGKTTGGWRRDLVDYAKQFIGTPYVYGAEGPDAFDCSSFTQWVFKKFGIDLPRVSADQGRFGNRIGLDNLKPGDLVLTNNSTRNFGADHVGIYIGHGRVISAPHSGASVMIDQLDSESWQWGVRLHRG